MIFKQMEKRKPPERTPRPALLDLVKLDGQWAQTIIAGNHVNYLLTNRQSGIDWNRYELVKRWGYSLQTLIELGQQISEREIQNIHWGPEEIEHPELKRQVTVFGEYVLRP